MEQYGWSVLLGAGDHNISEIVLNEPKYLFGIVPNGFQRVDASPAAYVLDLEDIRQQKHSFIVALGHCDLIIPVPTSPTEQILWIRSHGNLFFNPQIDLAGEGYNVNHTISVGEPRIFVYTGDALDMIAKGLSNRLVEAFKDDAFGETRREKTINFLQWHFPFYAAWIAYKRREHSEAVVRATLDTIAIAGGPLAKAFKKSESSLKAEDFSA